MTSDLSERLQSMYRRFNKRCYIHPDPLKMLYNYPEVGDREVVGFISSALVNRQIGEKRKSKVQKALDKTMRGSNAEAFFNKPLDQ